MGKAKRAHAAYRSFPESSGHVPGVAAIESNGRQYCPAANAPWEAHFPGLFRVTDGTMETSLLTGPGLGDAAPQRIDSRCRL